MDSTPAPPATTTWLLDVDGVLNISKSPWKTAPFRDAVYYNGITYPVRWAPQLLRRIRLLLRSGGVNVVWCTSYCIVADQLEALWSLPELPRAFSGDPDPGEELFAAKTVAAQLCLARGHRLIWTDDEVVPLEGALRDKLDAAGALLIRPQPSRGLTPEHMDLIEAYVATAS